MIDKSYSTLNFLKHALDGTWLRNETISNNITNVNTPGYKRMTVEFENLLKTELNNNKINLKTTNRNHIKDENSKMGEPRIVKNTGYSVKKDGNNVNIDTEMASLTKNTIMYNALIKQISSEFNKIKMIINEGRK